MSDADFDAALDPRFRKALAKRGYTKLTEVQKAVLDPSLQGRDLRISSQTGSGKTVAIGFALRHLFIEDEEAESEKSDKDKKAGNPRALIIAPTRELAKQIEGELTWLFEPFGVHLASLTGGASYTDERRSLGRRPGIVVATPGRLLDHLDRGSLSADAVHGLVLDEADRMLDMGFQEDLEKILSFLPEGRTTHLVSATFAREVQALARRFQQDPAGVEGTRLGSANADIKHIVYPVRHGDERAALVNLLLVRPGTQTLVFARTRLGVGEVARHLYQAGFSVTALSGDMSQDARNRALLGFKTGKVSVLVATDVAARGIDVADIERVIHLDPPDDPENYTHRSGRTGRAGRKGESILLVSMGAMRRATSVLTRARLVYEVKQLPTREEVLAGRDERIFADLMAPPEEGFTGYSDRHWGLAERLAASPEPVRVIARLLSQGDLLATVDPADVRSPDVPEARRARDAAGPRDFNGRGDYNAREPRRDSRDGYDSRDERDEGPPPTRGKRGDAGDFTTFKVTWGRLRGADARKMLAFACRRGDVRGQDIGAIHIDARNSFVDVRNTVADHFADQAQKPDPKDPNVEVTRAETRGAEPKATKPAGRNYAPRDEVPEVPQDKGSKRSVRDLEADAVPKDKGSRRSVRDLEVEAVPKDEGSRRSVRDLEADAVPKDKGSRRSVRDLEADAVPKEKGSKRSVRDLEADAVPKDKGSRRSVRDLEADAVPKDKGSKRSVRDLETEAVPKERGSKRSVRDLEAEAVPKERGSKRNVRAETDERPRADKPAFAKPAYDKPKFEQRKPPYAKPSYDKSAYAKPAYGKPKYDKPGADRPAYDKPRYDKPGADRPAYDKPRYDKPGADRPAYDKPRYDKPGADRPAYDKPRYDKPGADRPAYDKPRYDKSGPPDRDRPRYDGGTTRGPARRDDRPQRGDDRPARAPHAGGGQVPTRKPHWEDRGPAPARATRDDRAPARDDRGPARATRDDRARPERPEAPRGPRPKPPQDGKPFMNKGKKPFKKKP